MSRDVERTPTVTGPLMMDLEGTRLTAAEQDMLARNAVGGVILFSRNFENPAQLRTLIRAIRGIRPRLLIAVDQEGGRVQRFKESFTRIPPMRSLGRLYDRKPEKATALSRAAGWLLACELRDLDIDFSFAPVLDLDYGESAIIGDRSFHSDPGIVAELAGAWVKGMHEAGMAAVGKHFPGHGAVKADSHVELPQDGRTPEVIMAQDGYPFRELVNEGIEGIMPAHIVYQKADGQPAGFSRFWLRDMLQGELGFRGVVFSDDLTMAGAKIAGDHQQRAAAALDAGCDMVLVCNNPQAAAQVADWLENEGPKASPRLASMRGRTAPGPRGAFRSTARYRDTRAALMEMLDSEVV